MAQHRESPFHPSSPHSSSGGADSFKGTPDTRLTSFSPDENSAKSARFLRGVSHSASATPIKRSLNNFVGSTSSADKDPFTTPGRGKGLSPTASTFQPFTTVVRSALQTDLESISTTLSDERGLSRLLSLASPPSTSLSDVEVWLNDLQQQGVLSGAKRYTQVLFGCAYVQFDDIRDACQAHASSRLQQKDWYLDFVTYTNATKDVSRHFSLNDARPGQVLALAVTVMEPFADTCRVMNTMRKALQCHGTLFALARPSSFPDGTFRVLAEYCCATAAVTAARAAETPQTIEGLQLTVLLPSTIETASQELADVLEGLSVGKDTADIRQHGAVDSRPSTTANLHFPPFTMYPFMIQPACGPSLPYMVDGMSSSGQTSPIGPLSPGYSLLGALYRTPPSPALTSHNPPSPSRPIANYNRSEARRQNATRITRSPHHNAAGHHNHVDIQRIREGIDVRTTIMLRNIPNKVDQSMLKRIVDESSWGKYDFMYLRIDFANDCNVGYAFINFVDPLDIIDFVDARGNQRWNCFKSDKVAEVSYATIQGKDCLVQKFRNSSVMLEAPHYRPKLYFTSNGPMPELAGQEESFPDPDNQSKMKRSCENAEHVGLFTPNAGQHFRDEQRRRRSQYDRGTRLAALEEYDYESTFHQMYGSTH